PLLLVLLSTEAILRSWYSTLPSLDALKGYKKAPSFGEGTAGCNFQLQSAKTWGAGGILFLGDSITDGFGVIKEDRFTTHLAAAFPERQSEVLARPGADICMEIAMLDKRLFESRPPSLVVWEVMSDDLMGYMLYSYGGKPAATPAAEPNRIWRMLAENSYLLNLIWFQLRRHDGGRGGRIVSPAQRSQVVARLKELKSRTEASHIQLLPYLLEPAGWAYCSADVLPSQPCGWMAVDLGYLEGIFADAGLTVVDLRGLWKGRPLMVIPREVVTGPGGTGIHPNAEGHQLLANALRPHIQSALEQLKK
ncbi:MAG TPA: SGNH/GDSL hydrolase family protein, partial [Myxococcota bacterium]|nr:SGNH/GDSL hydrolase family protein [Myxococcota bacterium]